jgi:acyl-CoA thioester hydrolase
MRISSTRPNAQAIWNRAVEIWLLRFRTGSPCLLASLKPLKLPTPGHGAFAGATSGPFLRSGVAPAALQSETMASHETRLRVRYAETDQMGVVYHAHYLVWMEIGRVEFCRAHGIVYREMEERDGILLVVAEVNCRFASPARYDDEVMIRTSVEESNRRMIRFGYSMHEAASGRLLAEGFSKHIFCGRDFHPRKLPPDYPLLRVD